MNQITRWLMTPIAAARVFSGAKSFADPILGSERLNRRGLHVWRTVLAARLADRRRARLARLVPAEDRLFFAENGYIEKKDFLPVASFAALVSEVMAITAPAREMKEGDAITRRILVTDDVLRKAPALRAMLSTPEWRGLTRYVASFDEEPLVSIQTVFGKAGGAAEDPQTSLHMDTFHTTMKAWFFLHEVADDEGPLTFVPGSHRLTPRRLAWQKRQSVLASTMPDRKGGAFRLQARELHRLHWPQPRRFAVPGNTLVVGDTSGFHARAHSTKPTRRIEIYASSRPNPFKPVTKPGFDTIPLVGPRRWLLAWWVQDRLAPLGLMRHIWRDVGRLTPGSPVVTRD